MNDGHRFGLLLHGQWCGFIREVRGGNMFADVIEEPVGPDLIVKKHLGPTRFEDVEIDVDLRPSQLLCDWIAHAWRRDHGGQRKDGTIVVFDSQSNIVSERNFFHAPLLEVTVPACDVLSKESHLTLRFRPEEIRTVKPGGRSYVEVETTAQQIWHPSNFRLEIPGLDTSHVAKIDAFAVREAAIDPHHPARWGNLSFPDLRITISESKGAQGWVNWFEDFVLRGNNEANREKSGKLVFLSSDLQDVLRINLLGLGIFRMGPETSVTSRGDASSRLTVDLYCQRMEFV